MGNMKLLCVWAVLLWGTCSAVQTGREFITTFMQNYLGTSADTLLELEIISYEEATTVTVSVNQNPLRKVLVLGKDQTASVKLPNFLQLKGNTHTLFTVIITSSKDISVVSVNKRSYTMDAALIYPVSALGNEYYIFTPPNKGNSKEFTVINTGEPNTIQIYRVNTRKVQTISLKPYENYQFQSRSDLSRSRIVSVKPVAVLSGHTCVYYRTKCNHVFEQLPPVSSWGKTFIVAPLSVQRQFDLIYVLTSKDTEIRFGQGGQKPDRLKAGQMTSYQISQSRPLSITASEGIMVMFYCTGGVLSRQFRFDPFLVNVVPVSQYSTGYRFQGRPGFSNFANIIARTSDTARLKMDKKVKLASLKWENIKGTAFSWADLRFSDLKLHSVAGEAVEPFSLYVYGVTNRDAYGFQASPDAFQVSDPCIYTKCVAKEKCRVVNGKAECQPIGGAVCWASGDPHYSTFDGQKYDFQGTCKYTIAKTCGTETSLPSFKVEAKNANRGSTKVSYVDLVNIYVYDLNITVLRREHSLVRVNDLKSNLPLLLHDGKLKLFQSGSYMLLETDFDLKVKYDWNHHLEVRVTSSFQDRLCGLCGNYNGKPDDDFKTPGGQVASAPNDFAASWKVNDGDKACWDNCKGKCPVCDERNRQKYQSVSNCGLISKPNGPFKDCHDRIDPADYVTNCVYDVCLVKSHQQLCQALKVYTEDCQREGADIGDWRTPSNCRLRCPAKSEYKACASACPATCTDPQAEANCGQPCVESCRCKPGYVLSAGNCVSQQSCGCTSNGQYYKPDQTIWGNDQCTKKCRCNPLTKKLDCVRAKCKASETCKVLKGVRGCHPVSYATCRASGDPHYKTFDGKTYDFMGTCVYRFSALCGDDKELEPFEVRVQNENRGNKAVSYTRLAWVQVYNHTLVITRQHTGKIIVNGVLANLPLTVAGVSVYRSGWGATLQTDFGLRVTYDWRSRITVTLPSTYSGQVCGLCGDFDRNKQNDLTMKGGKPAPNPTQFGESWQVATTPGCSSQCQGKCPQCDIVQKQRYVTNAFCGPIKDEAGPFRLCLAKVEPSEYFDDCVFDACLYKGRALVVCDALTAYTAACQDVGVQLFPWRTPTFCPQSCPKNSHYELCASGCPETCTSLLEPRECDEGCREGCQCDEGFVLSGEQCVPLEACGCVYKGEYYKARESFFCEEKCSGKCRCQPGGIVERTDFTCPPKHECRLVNGRYGCLLVDVPDTGSCSAAGVLHYRSFDGLAFDFEGTCTYTLAKVWEQEKWLTPFTVNVENRSYGNSKVAVTRLVEVDVYGYKLILETGVKWSVQVDGVAITLPLEIDGGKIRASQHGNKIVVETDFGLEVSYDLVYRVVVTVPGDYQGKMRGLCGNFNGDREDEFLLPSDKQADDVTSFCKGWKVPVQGAKCDDGCGNQCPVCEQNKINVFKGVSLCGFLTASDSPLRACHSTVDPEQYFQDCLYDLCKANGNTKMLCDSLQAYVSACQAKQVDVKTWRSKTFCPLQCPSNSHYEQCAQTCTGSCAAVSGFPNCPKTCTEGCECDDGFYADGDQCISSEKCGCFENGQYYKSEEYQIQNNCTKKCKCTKAEFVCEDFSCPKKQYCEIKGGKMGCDSDIKCPENSHYAACAIACPATCEDPLAPLKCKQRCVEGCDCDEGHVKTGDKCVSIQTCGCAHGGRVYKPNDRFWSDGKCEELCVCNPASNKVLCHKSKCKLREQCALVDGVPSCVPTSQATCWASGDLHYISFDGGRFDFQGTCVYQLAALCYNDPNLIPFKVDVQNNHRGNNAVAFTKVVLIEVHETTIVISVDNPLRITVNQVSVALPYNLDTNRIVAYRSGWTAVVKTDFGLRVTFDWKSRVSVTLPSNYANSVCGLCGNYNSDREDDLKMPDGKPAPSAVAFGHSWKVADIPGCTAGCTENCPVCDTASKVKYQGRNYCDIIRSRTGPFRDCHATIDPKGFFESCVFDVCQYQGIQAPLCDALSAYTEVCQQAGVEVHQWRSNDFCPSNCPRHSHYELCGSGCPTTCSPSEGCEASCKEGCQCDSGFTLSGEECVPLNQCGCRYEGRYYKRGEVFYPRDLCQEKCTCQDNKQVACENFTCCHKQECKVVDGVKGCHAEGCGKCVAAGDLHYVSFDGLAFDFQGTCTYTLTKVMVEDKKLVKFHVQVENKKLGNGGVTRLVLVEVYGHKFLMKKDNRWKMWVDDELIYLPYTLPSKTVKVTQEGVNLVLKTAFGLQVTYDAVYYVAVGVPSTYQDKLGGLCGNFNGLKTDEFKSPDGQVLSNPTAFGSSWKVVVEGAKCADGCEGQCPECDPSRVATFQSVDQCGLLTTEKSSLHECHQLINPHNYFQHCVYDVCKANGDVKVLCDSIQAYVSACQAVGVNIESWRTPTFCPLACPANSHYKVCADTCGSNCAGLLAPVTCKFKCTEGCQCDSGFVFSGEQCIPIAKCGCTFEGRYIQLGETVLTDDCKAKCSCQASGVVHCQSVSCSTNEICEVRDGVRNCFKDGTCSIKQGKRFTTFDGLSGDVRLPGVYEIASLCNTSSSAWFRVVADFRVCDRNGNPGIATTYMFFQDTFIAINAKKQIWVNGRPLKRSQLPYSASSTVTLRVKASYVVAEHSSKIMVWFDGSQELTVTLVDEYAGRLCGPCGNFNGNLDDELVLPGGEAAGNVVQLVTRWLAEDFSVCTD